MNRPGLILRAGVAAILLAASAVASPPPVSAQYSITSPSGDSLSFELPELRGMLETARELYADLEEDPRVLYRLGFGPAAERTAPAPAYPWNAVRPQSDSVVNVLTPGNLREADRAYHNYAVMRMREIRGEDPDDPCDALVEREEEVLSSFVDGWILSRTLFGGPAFAPLDELAFARASGHLRALLAALGDASVAGCAASWAETHADAVTAYESWRADAFPGLAELPAEPMVAPKEAPERPAFEEPPAQPDFADPPPEPAEGVRP